MDLDQYKKLQQETEQYRNSIENIEAGKIALDRQYVKKLQEALALETDCIKKDIEIQKLKKEIESLNVRWASIRSDQAEKEISELAAESCS